MKNGRYSTHRPSSQSGSGLPTMKPAPSATRKTSTPRPTSHQAALRQPPPHTTKATSATIGRNGATFSTGRTLGRSLPVHDA